jgi:hypothetical protein
VNTGATQQFTVKGKDQFGNVMAGTPTVTWTATGGTVSSSGLFTAGSTAGTASVKVTSGSITQTATITISVFQDPALAQLIYTYYVDQNIDRLEMIEILRSVGSDSTVSATELADLRKLVTSTEFVMPKHVRGLAHDVVHTSPANLKFQGQTLGNLAAGSTSEHLNKLVDKWFLGVDLPAILGSGITYVTSTGTLFTNTPSLSDAKQGQVGDCYVIASLVSIAHRNPEAVRDMFVDNGDGTYTVRFFSSVGVSDYVTVNRKLPVYSNNTLAYAGYGFSALSTTTTLWIALAEKAYAQWNETGNAGRNGTNTYAGIEGGWMHNMNRQVLGYNSTNHYFSSSTQQTLIDALASGKAVTLGTNGTVSAGLVGGHAYTVVRYESSNNTFILDNPWGFNDPAGLTWSQLVANCILFTATDPAGSGPADPPGGLNSVFVATVATWTQSSMSESSVARTEPVAEELSKGWSRDEMRGDASGSGIATSVAHHALLLEGDLEEGDLGAEEGVEFSHEKTLRELAMIDLYLEALRG